MIRHAMVVVLLASPALAETGGVLERDACQGGIEVKVDLPSARAAQAKISGQYTVENAEYDATYICRGVVTNLERLCLVTRGPDEGAGPPPSPVVGKVKSVRCVILDGPKDAPHQQELKDGVWTVKYTLWSNRNLLWDAQKGQPHGPNSLMNGLGNLLKLKVPEENSDELFRGFSDQSERCTQKKDCSSGLICGKDTQNGMNGPRCVKAGPASCSKGGDAFGHADKACPAGQWCTQAGVCFPKGDFPARGRKLGRGARCYYDAECASKRCPGHGMDRFADHVGECTGR